MAIAGLELAACARIVVVVLAWGWLGLVVVVVSCRVLRAMRNSGASRGALWSVMVIAVGAAGGASGTGARARVRATDRATTISL